MRKFFLCPLKQKSGRWDSNPRISAWKADALPLGDARVVLRLYTATPRSSRERIDFVERIDLNE